MLNHIELFFQVDEPFESYEREVFPFIETMII